MMPIGNWKERKNISSKTVMESYSFQHCMVVSVGRKKTNGARVNGWRGKRQATQYTPISLPMHPLFEDCKICLRRQEVEEWHKRAKCKSSVGS